METVRCNACLRTTQKHMLPAALGGYQGKGLALYKPCS